MVPAAIYMARAGDFQAIGTFAGQFGARLATGLNAGMALSVMCAEDAPFFDAAVVDRGRETFLGPTMAENIARACETWPRGDVGEGFHDDLASDVPVLMVSGDVDPVTPPEYAERAARTLPNGLHLVIPNTAHIPTSPGCVEELLQQFIRDGAVDGLDTSCVTEIRRPGFLVP
jgi:pimeloyl-ACP methyl ester carboxylesterase